MTFSKETHFRIILASCQGMDERAVAEALEKIINIDISLSIKIVRACREQPIALLCGLHLKQATSLLEALAPVVFAGAVFELDVQGNRKIHQVGWPTPPLINGYPATNYPIVGTFGAEEVQIGVIDDPVYPARNEESYFEDDELFDHEEASSLGPSGTAIASSPSSEFNPDEIDRELLPADEIDDEDEVEEYDMSGIVGREEVATEAASSKTAPKDDMESLFEEMSPLNDTKGNPIVGNDGLKKFETDFLAKPISGGDDEDTNIDAPKVSSKPKVMNNPRRVSSGKVSRSAGGRRRSVRKSAGGTDRGYNVAIPKTGNQKAIELIAKMLGINIAQAKSHLSKPISMLARDISQDEAKRLVAQLKSVGVVPKVTRQI